MESLFRHTLLEFVSHTDLPAFDIIVIIIDIYIRTSIHDMGIPLRRNIIANTYRIGIDIIADANAGKSLPTVTNRNLSLQTSLYAIIVGIAIRICLDIADAAISCYVRAQAIDSQYIVFIYLITVVTFRIIVHILKVEVTVNRIGYITTGEAAICTMAAFLLVKSIVDICLEITRFGVLLGAAIAMELTVTAASKNLIIPFLHI